jgi:tripartite-type tricarboxylate transporter receptor subunit TctC
MAGVNIVRIPYKSVALRMTGLLTNEVQMEFSTPSGLAQFIKAGKLKALAVTTAQPSPLVPGLPTIAASGLPGYESAAVYAFFAPAKTPAAIIKRLNQEVVAVLRRDDVKEKFSISGIDAVGSTPQELAAVMKSEMAKLGKVIKEAGIRAE